MASASSASLPRSAAGKHNPWLIAVVVSMATFMEVLDTTIANVSLRHIAGSLGAGQDESTWIITSYLISNAIILPISGWLSNLIGRKRFYMGCVALFTFSSFLCALAPNLTSMIFFRVLQGLGGGGLAPTEQSIFADTFTPEKRAAAFSLYGVTVIVAPAVGPVLGGWLTQSYSWHWIFLINLPIGLLALTLIYFLIEDSPAVKKATAKFRKELIPDWLGFTLVALTFGCLQFVLDRFQQDDGFASTGIIVFATICLFSAISLVVWELLHPQPVFDVRLFGTRSFAIACLFMFLLGFTIYSTTQLIPQLAQTLLSYDALQAGKALALGGVAAALIMPFAGTIGKKVPPKYVIMVAFIVTGFAFLHTAHLNLNVSLHELSMARVYQSIALPFLFVTLTTAGYVGIKPEKNADASAIINLMRNLGGSVGVSIATTEVAWRTQFHHARLAESVSSLAPSGYSLAQGGIEAAQRVVQAQAQIMSYLDVYWIWGVGALCIAPLALLLKNPPKGAEERIDMIRLRLFMAALAATCAACTVGPTYRRPDVATPDGWSPEAGRAFETRPGSIATVRPFDGTRWWAVFDDPVLEMLVQRAAAQNLDVQTAGLRIAEARAQRDAAAGALYPSVAGSVVAGRARLSQNGFTQNLAGGSGSSGSGAGGGSGGATTGASAAPAATSFDAFQVGFDALWEIDLFGKTRRNVEAAVADIASAEEARRDALVSLTAEIARTYFSLRGAERRLAVAQADIETQERLAKLIASRNRAGIVSSSDTAAQTAQVAAARSQVPPIEQAIGQARNRLALLLALPPGGIAGLVQTSARLPGLPPQVPIGLPADLLRRRPDIRQREADLRSATARVGVATAQLFPSIRLGLTGGLQSSRASSLFEWASRFFLGGTQVSIPIFQGGQLRAQVRVADLQSQEAVLAYRQTVLNAFHDVDNALIAYDGEQRRTGSLQKQLDDARRSRELALHRYEAGLGAFTAVLDAERTSHQSELALTQSSTDATTDLVALYKALGGGWNDDSAAAVAGPLDQRVGHGE